MVTRGIKDGLKTKVNKKKITLNNAKKEDIEDISSRSIDRNEAVSMYKNTIAKEVKTVMESQSTKNTENRKRIVEILMQLRKIFIGSKTIDDDEIEDKADNKADDKQQDTADMPDLKGEESDEQGKKQKDQGRKILTSDQMLSRLPIF